MYNNITNPIISQAQINTINQIKSKKAVQQKMLSSLVSALQQTDHVTQAIIDRVSKCGTFIRVNHDGKISGANFCKNRLCPLCQWRLSRKVYAQTRLMQSVVEARAPTSRYIFLTLTIRNVTRIDEGINTLQQGFHRFINDRKIKQVIQGYIKTIEITYNAAADTWHPHIHMVIIVPQNYFKDPALYLTHDDWVSLWQRAAQVSYIPSVDVRIVTDDKTRGSAIAEISKYAVKPIDLSAAKNDTADLYIQLIQSTYNRRLRSYGGLYRQAARQININVDDPTDDCDIDDDTVDYIYNGQDYQIYRLSLLIDNNGEVANHEA